MSFEYRGEIPASKSILNRLLIIQSFRPGLVIEGGSQADDVVKMRAALASLIAGRPADCGAAGTTLRFLALRASRIPGRHILHGSPRLMQRPQDEIMRLLKQLGCRVEFHPGYLLVEGDGWKLKNEPIIIDPSISSQFASAVFLSAWDLPTELRVRRDGEAVSEGYFEMTLRLAERAGLVVRREGAELVVPPHARVSADRLRAEIDVSSAFAVAALAAVAGRAELEAWPQNSLQPDAVFPRVLEAMGCRVSERTGLLTVDRAPELKAIEWNLRDCPDLFPVLSVLCALARGRSRLFGAPHLAHKESSRILKSAELVRLMGAQAEPMPDGMVITGSTERREFPFDPEHDHRLAMAAAVARAAGHKVEILRPEVVDKSFPEFWTVADQAGA